MDENYCVIHKKMVLLATVTYAFFIDYLFEMKTTINGERLITWGRGGGAAYDGSIWSIKMGLWPQIDRKVADLTPYTEQLGSVHI